MMYNPTKCQIVLFSSPPILVHSIPILSPNIVPTINSFTSDHMSPILPSNGTTVQSSTACSSPSNSSSYVPLSHATNPTFAHPTHSLM